MYTPTRKNRRPAHRHGPTLANKTHAPPTRAYTLRQGKISIVTPPNTPRIVHAYSEPSSSLSGQQIWFPFVFRARTTTQFKSQAQRGRTERRQAKLQGRRVGGNDLACAAEGEIPLEATRARAEPTGTHRLPSVRGSGGSARRSTAAIKAITDVVLLFNVMFW